MSTSVPAAGQPTNVYNPIGSVDRNQEATIYVANLDERCTDDLLWELFTQVGPVVHVYIPKDRIAHTQSGYGFVEFQNEVDAEYAVQIMSGVKLFTKPLKVNKASQNKQVFDIGANLYIANLDASVDERILQDTFSVFGRVLQVKLGKDNDTGAPRGFAFLNYDSFEAADAAIEAMNGQFIHNRPITVSYAYKKDGKPGERHGTAAERLLAEQARKNNVMLYNPQPNASGVSSAVTAQMTASAQAFLNQPQMPMMMPYVYGQQPVYGQQQVYAQPYMQVPFMQQYPGQSQLQQSPYYYQQQQQQPPPQ